MMKHGKNAYEDCKQYFEDGEMLGWFVAQPGVELDAKSNIVKLHKKIVPETEYCFCYEGFRREGRILFCA